MNTAVEITAPATDPQSRLASGLIALKPQDVQAICRELKLPIPTPDVPLDAILEASGLTPAAVFTRLERCTSVDAMIAAAVLRRGVTVVARDPRLNPAPHRLRWDLTPEARSGRPRPAATDRKIADPGMPPADHVVLTVGECGSAAGSKRAVRFERYKVGLTVHELCAGEGGLKGSDIRRHISEGRITFGPRVA